MESKTKYEISRLKSLRLQAKMTQVELSRITGVKQCVISDLERGRRELTWGWARQIAPAMDMSIEELMKEVHGDYSTNQMKTNQKASSI